MHNPIVVEQYHYEYHQSTKFYSSCQILFVCFLLKTDLSCATKKEKTLGNYWQLKN